MNLNQLTPERKILVLASQKKAELLERLEQKRKKTKKPLTQIQQKAYKKIAEEIKKGNDAPPMTYGILLREVSTLYEKGWIDKTYGIYWFGSDIHYKLL